MGNDICPPPLAGEQQPAPYGIPRVNPQPGFFEAVKMGISRWNDFSGRSRRAEYWWFTLFLCLYGIIASMAFSLVCIAFAAADSVLFLRVFFIGILMLILPTILPYYALLTRRLHDSGKSGYWLVVQVLLSAVFLVCYFMMLPDLIAIQFGNHEAIARNAVPLAITTFASVPLYILQLVIFVFTLLDSKRGVNKWGPSPKYSD